MSAIKDVVGLEIIDSRGNPTVEAEVVLASGARGRAAVPSGASTGSREAHELRDGDKKRYLGKGVRKAVANVDRRDPQGRRRSRRRRSAEARQQAHRARRHAEQGAARRERDPGRVAREREGACGRSRRALCSRLLGGGKRELQLPLPMMNIINGGAHADNSVDIQEFMILPVGAPTFSECLRYGVEVFHALKAVLKAKGLNTAVGDEGGFAPDFGSNEEALQTIAEAVEKAGYTLGRDIYLGLDVASSEFFKNGEYHLESEDRKFSSAEFADFLEDLVARYPIVSIEDGMAENDWDGWQHLSTRAARQDPARGRRPVRHEHGDPEARYREEDREQHPDQAEPDRHADRDARSDRDGAEGRLLGRRLAPLGRNRGRDDRRYRGGDGCDADQNGIAVSVGPSGQV